MVVTSSLSLSDLDEISSIVVVELDSTALLSPFIGSFTVSSVPLVVSV